MTASILALVLLAQGERQAIDLGRTSSFVAIDGLQVEEGSMRLAPNRDEPWAELFKGKKDFGLMTGVFALKGKLLFLDSPLPAATDGGDVYLWDERQHRPRRVLQVKEQGAIVIRETLGKLVMPGPDAMEAWDRGNFYQSPDGEQWSKVRTIQNAVHVWDMCAWKGKLYASTGSVRNSEGYAGVLESTDGGRKWREILAAFPQDRKLQFARCYALIPLPDGLYASFIAIDNDPKKPGKRTANAFYKYDGSRWKPLPILAEPPRTPYFGLRHREFGDFSLIGAKGASFELRNEQVSQVLGLDGWTAFDFMETPRGGFLAVGTDATGRSALLAAAKGPDKAPTEFRVWETLPEGQEGLSMTWRGSRVLVGTKSKDGGRLLIQSVHPEGEAFTKTIRIRNKGTLQILWNGDQPLGSTIKFQVHAARSARELERMGSWSETEDRPSLKAIELKGLPKQELWLQLRITLKTTTQMAAPELRELIVTTK